MIPVLNLSIPDQRQRVETLLANLRLDPKQLATRQDEALANVPRYTEWLQQQDWTDAYARHKQNLQLVGLNDPEKRWVLKNPSHLTALDALMTVYPDALIVYTHRDPVTCIASSL